MGDENIGNENLDSLNKLYSGRLEESEHSRSTYKIEDLFPSMVEHEKWLNFITDLILDSEGEIIRDFESLEDIGSRKKAEKFVKDQYNFLYHLVDTIPYPIFYKDINFVYVGCNKAFEDFIGLSKDEIIGKTVYDISPKNLADEYHEKDKELFDNPSSQSYESPVQYADGTRHIVLFNKTTFEDKKGHLAGLIGLMVDITELKKAEEALRESERKYRDLVDNSVVSVYKTNLEGDLIFYNQALMELFGLDSPMEIINTNVRSWYKNSSDRDILMKLLHEEGSFKDYEVEMVTKSGKTINVILNSILDGDIISGMMMDVTQRKMVEKELKSEKNRLTVLTENAPIGLVLLDKNGNYKYINPKFKELFGYGLDEIPNGVEWFKKAYPDRNYRKKAINAWINDFQNASVGEKKPRTFNVTCKDSTIKVIHFVPVLLETGEYLMTVEDITQRKKDEKALKTSEERFRTLAQSAVDAIVITDIQDVIVFCNEGLQEIFGYYDDEIVGQQLSIIMPDKTKMKIRGYTHENLPGRLLESYGLRKDGSEFPVEISVTGWEVEGEEYTTHIIRDITDRKLTEYKLKMREEMFSKMAENIDEVFWVVDPLMNQIQYVSPAYEKVWGNGVSSLYKNPESLLDSIHPEDRELVTRNIFPESSRIHRRRMDAFEFRIFRPDGGIRWIKSRVFPVIDEDKKTYRIIGIALDVTRRREMEEKLKELEKN